MLALVRTTNAHACTAFVNWYVNAAINYQEVCGAEDETRAADAIHVYGTASETRTLLG